MGDEEELCQRRNSELEFIGAAYGHDEAWWGLDSHDGLPRIHRRLHLKNILKEDNYDHDHDETPVGVILTLTMPVGYPASEALEISAVVEETKINNSNKMDSTSLVVKAAWNAIPKLTNACREVANDSVGEEAIFLVLGRADDWIQEEWPSFRPCTADLKSAGEYGQNHGHLTISKTTVLGRRLIYSHHLISKIKRSDIISLARHHKLTGYMKIGWPGIIILEGSENDCNEFYDNMRKWNWKYLVVRGEQQEVVLDVDANRKFTNFIETEDMSVVAQHCRDVGLEALFRTSMKVYNNSGASDALSETEGDNIPFGSLLHVDHMNDGKKYRQWLRKTAAALDIFLLIKQSYPNHDFSKKPLILVAAVGDRDSVQQFLKRWRTSRVDVDTSGKPCLERMMTMLIDGVLATPCAIESMDWNTFHSEESLNISRAQLEELVGKIGGDLWKDCLREKDQRYLH